MTFCCEKELAHKKAVEFFNKYNVSEEYRDVNKLVEDIMNGKHTRFLTEEFDVIENFSVSEFITKMIKLEWVIVPLKILLKPALLIFNTISDAVLKPILSVIQDLISAITGKKLTIATEVVHLIQTLVNTLYQFGIMVIDVFPSMVAATIKYFTVIQDLIINNLSTIKDVPSFLMALANIVFEIFYILFSDLISGLYSNLLIPALQDPVLMQPMILLMLAIFGKIILVVIVNFIMWNANDPNTVGIQSLYEYSTNISYARI